MTNPIRILRSQTAAARPIGRQSGQIWVNFADGVFGYIDANGNAVDVASTSLLANAIRVGGNGSTLTNLNASALTTGTVADARLPASILRAARRVLTGAGLTGGGDLTEDRTLSVTGRLLGVNNLSGTGVMVATPSGGVVQRSVLGGPGITATNSDGQDGNIFVSVDDTVVRNTATVTAGDGLFGGGTLGGDRVIAMGPPSPITATSTNTATPGSHSHALPESAVRNLIAQGTAGALGTYAFLRRAVNQVINAGTTYPASDLAWAGALSFDDGSNVSFSGNGGPGSGTWRAMGTINPVPTGRMAMTLFLRIA